MKKVIPFTKEIPFKTSIAEITDIEVTHSLKAMDEEISGSFLVDGTYKILETSMVDETFHYDLPFTVEVDEKYDISEVSIKINDFYFEILNEDTLKINIELELGNVKEKEILESEVVPVTADVRCFDDEEGEEEKKTETSTDKTNSTLLNQKVNPPYDSEMPEDFTDIIIPVDEQEEKMEMVNKTPKSSDAEKNAQQVKQQVTAVSDIFNDVSGEDSYQSYYVYIVREGDTVDMITNKYKITKDDISMYNDMNEIKVGKKLIIPCSNE